MSIGALAFWGDCAAPLGLNKCVSMIDPGLAPRAMQEYRPKGLLYVYPIIIILDYFDALALLLFFRNLEKYIIFVINKVSPLETGAVLMAALWEVFLFCKCKVRDYSLAFRFYMEF